VVVRKGEKADSEKTGPQTARLDDPDRRRAARIATIVAVPVTLIAGVGAVALIGNAADSSQEPPDQLTVPSSAVSVKVPDLSQHDAEVCRALVTELPGELGKLPQRAVTGDGGASEIAAAWGDPAVTLRCGVEPVEVAGDAQLFRLGETCWYVAETKQHTTWTTVDRENPVEVAVPAKLDEPGQLVQGLTTAVSKKVPPLADVPTGCTG
jgi:hypothetical protein